MFCTLQIIEIFHFENQHFPQNINHLGENHSKTYYSPPYFLKQRIWFNSSVITQDYHYEPPLWHGRVAQGWAYIFFCLLLPWCQVLFGYDRLELHHSHSPTLKTDTLRKLQYSGEWAHTTWDIGPLVGRTWRETLLQPCNSEQITCFSFFTVQGG